MSSMPEDVLSWRPTHSLPCSAWDRWVLLALHRHRARQAFVEVVVHERLGVTASELGRAGAFAHPDEKHGVVPGLPTWHYEFHGRGCCLTNVDGTEIDVDFDEHGAASVDP